MIVHLATRKLIFFVPQLTHNDTVRDISSKPQTRFYSEHNYCELVPNSYSLKLSFSLELMLYKLLFQVIMKTPAAGLWLWLKNPEQICHNIDQCTQHILKIYPIYTTFSNGVGKAIFHSKNKKGHLLCFRHATKNYLLCKQLALHSHEAWIDF